MAGEALQPKPKMLFKSRKEALNHLRANGKYNKDGELVLDPHIKTMNYKLIEPDEVSNIVSRYVSINNFKQN